MLLKEGGRTDVLLHEVGCGDEDRRKALLEMPFNYNIMAAPLARYRGEYGRQHRRVPWQWNIQTLSVRGTDQSSAVVCMNTKGAFTDPGLSALKRIVREPPSGGTMTVSLCIGLAISAGTGVVSSVEYVSCTSWNLCPVPRMPEVCVFSRHYAK